MDKDIHSAGLRLLEVFIHSFSFIPVSSIEAQQRPRGVPSLMLLAAAQEPRFKFEDKPLA